MKNRKRTKTLQQLHLMVIRSLFVMMCVQTLHARIPLGWLIQHRRFISLHVEISSLPTPMAVMVRL